MEKTNEMKMSLRTIISCTLMCVLTCFASGCVSAYCHSRSIEVQGEPTYIYPGTQVDIVNISHGSLGYILDFPFSFCLDTIALPFDLYAVGIKGLPRYDNPLWPLPEIVPTSTNGTGKTSQDMSKMK